MEMVSDGRRSRDEEPRPGPDGWSRSFRWEEERYTDGVKWKFLEHKGPVFVPPYEPLPSNVRFYYDGGSGPRQLLRPRDLGLTEVFT